jgi:hypothetical protein
VAAFISHHINALVPGGKSILPDDTLHIELQNKKRLTFRKEIKPLTYLFRKS